MIARDRNVPFGADSLYGPPALATTLMLYKCYIPGGSIWNALGVCLWLFVVPVLLVAFFQVFKSSLSEFGKSVWPVGILFCVSILSITDIPCELGLLTSISQFESFTRVQKQTGYSRGYLELPSLSKIQLGIYPIYDFKCDDLSSYFVTSVTGLLDRDISGFAFRPSKEERLDSHIHRRFTHLWGDWYSFYEREKF